MLWSHWADNQSTHRARVVTPRDVNEVLEPWPVDLHGWYPRYALSRRCARGFGHAPGAMRM